MKQMTGESEQCFHQPQQDHSVQKKILKEIKKATQIPNV